MTTFPNTPAPTGGRSNARRSFPAVAAVAIVVVLAAALSPRAAGNGEPQVTVREDRGTYSVSVTFTVEQPAAAARVVLTDYDHIATFMPDLKQSRVLHRREDRVVVEQEAIARFLFFSRQIHLHLEIVEAPGVLRFKDICGKSFAAYEGAWTFTDREPGSTITYELRAKPAFEVPGFVLKRLLARDVNRMIDALRREIAVRAR